jgi:RimJ/RimL family protein N-acetyltransferase
VTPRAAVQKPDTIPVRILRRALPVVNRVVYAEHIWFWSLRPLPAQSSEPRAEITWRLLSPHEARAACARPGWEFPKHPERLAAGDQVAGFYVNRELAGYAWYADTPAPLTSAFLVRPDPDSFYVHRIFVDPQHRGRRIHAVTTQAGLDLAAQAGRTQLLCATDVLNQAAIRACIRAGFKRWGRLWVCGVLGVYRYRWRFERGVTGSDPIEVRPSGSMG